MIKLRQHFTILPEEAMFLFFDGRLYAVSRHLREIRAVLNKKNDRDRPLNVELLKENTYGMGWSKLFIKASVVQKKSLFVARITWSWFGMSHYDEIEVFETLQEANLWILRLRTDGHLVYDTDSDEKKEIEVPVA